jgi:hypothetical protein
MLKICYVRLVPHAFLSCRSSETSMESDSKYWLLASTEIKEEAYDELNHAVSAFLQSNLKHSEGPQH